VVEQHGSILGLSEVLVAHDSEVGDEESELNDDDVQEEEEEEEVIEVEKMRAAATASAEMREHVEYLEKKLTSIRSQLLVGGMVLVRWKKQEGFFLARVAKLPATPKAYTFQAEWLDEVEPNTYELDARWPKSSAKIKDVIDVRPPLTQLAGGRWMLNVQPAAATPSATAKPATATPSATTKPTAAKSTAAKPAVSKPAVGKADPVDPAKRYLDEVDLLLTGAGKLRSDRPILTRRDSEWLNDCQIANDNELLQIDHQHARFLNPMSNEYLSTKFFCKKKVKRLAPPDAQLSDRRYSLVMSYSMLQLHWHILFLCCAERTMYHFEGFGGEVDDEVQVAFATVFAHHGWELVSIPLELQHDSSSCGVWIQVARDAYLEYINSSDLGTKSFPAFMEQWLEQRGVVR